MFDPTTAPIAILSLLFKTEEIPTNISGAEVPNATIVNPIVNSLTPIFFAIKGESYNGLDYVNESINKGAIAILCDSIPNNINKKTVYVIVDNVEIALGIISSNFYDNPSSKLKLIGITGTNGKSTTTSLIGHLLSDNNIETEIVGNIGKPILKSKNLDKKGVYIIELSSYQIDLCPNLDLDIAVLLNISPDHLERHGSLNNYIKANKEFVVWKKTYNKRSYSWNERLWQRENSTNLWNWEAY